MPRIVRIKAKIKSKEPTRNNKYSDYTNYMLYEMPIETLTRMYNTGMLPAAMNKDGTWALDAHGKIMLIISCGYRPSSI